MGRLYTLAIFYFSGTGNTRLLAEKYAAALRDLGVRVDLSPIEKYTGKEQPLETAKYDAIGIGYPIHAFSAPRLVFEFMRLLPAGNGKRAFIFKCPGDFFANGGSILPVRRRLAGKGYDVTHESMLVMPANFSVPYPPALAKELYNIAVSRIELFAQEILAGKTRLQKNPFLARLCTLLAPFEQLGARLARPIMYTRSTCNGCGSCAEQCPAKNITMNNGRPAFNWRCLACLRCVYGCPQNAIGMRVIGSLLFKDGYNIRRVVQDENIPDTYTRPGMNGYFKRYYTYANDPEFKG